MLMPVCLYERTKNVCTALPVVWMSSFHFISVFFLVKSLVPRMLQSCRPWTKLFSYCLVLLTDCLQLVVLRLCMCVECAILQLAFVFHLWSSDFFNNLFSSFFGFLERAESAANTRNMQSKTSSFLLSPKYVYGSYIFIYVYNSYFVFFLGKFLIME